MEMSENDDDEDGDAADADGSADDGMAGKGDGMVGPAPVLLIPLWLPYGTLLDVAAAADAAPSCGRTRTDDDGSGVRTACDGMPGRTGPVYAAAVG